MAKNPTKIERFTPGNLETVRACIAEALTAPVVAGLGLTIELGRMTYNREGTRFTMPLEVIVSGALNKDQERYEVARKYSGGEFPPRGWKFQVRGREFTVDGQTQGRKIIAIATDNAKAYTWKPQDIRAIYAREQAKGAS